MAKTSITLHKNDLPAGLSFGDAVAVDTETLGLNLNRDRLCLVQLSAGDGDRAPRAVRRPRLRGAQSQGAADRPGVLKIFHFARFDIAVLEKTSASSRRRSTAPRSPPSWCAPTPTATG